MEATNFFFGFPGQDEELELTFNHDGRSYELWTGYGHIAIGVEDLNGTLARLKTLGIKRGPYRVRDGGPPALLRSRPRRSLLELTAYPG